MYKYVCGVLQAYIRQYPACKLDFHTSTSSPGGAQTGRSQKSNGSVKSNKLKNLKHKQLTSSKRKKAFFLYKIIWEKLVNPLLELVTPGLKSADQLTKLGDFRTHGGFVSKIEDSGRPEQEVCSKCLEEPKAINFKKSLEIEDCIIKDPLKIVKSYNSRSKEFKKTVGGRNKGKLNCRKLKSSDNVKESKSSLFYNILLKNIIENKVEKMMPYINDNQVTQLWDFRVQQDSVNIILRDHGLETTKVVEKVVDQLKPQTDKNNSVLSLGSNVNIETTIKRSKPLSASDNNTNNIKTTECKNIPETCPGPIFMTLPLNDINGNVREVNSGKDKDTIVGTLKIKKVDGKGIKTSTVQNVKIQGKVKPPQQRIANGPNLKEDVIKKLIKITNSTSDQKITELKVKTKPVHTKGKPAFGKLNVEVANSTGKIRVNKNVQNDLKLIKVRKLQENKKGDSTNRKTHENLDLPEIQQPHGKSQSENIHSVGEEKEMYNNKDEDTRKENDNNNQLEAKGGDNLLKMSEDSTEIEVKVNEEENTSQNKNKLDNLTVDPSNNRDSISQLESAVKENNPKTKHKERLSEQVKSERVVKSEDVSISKSKEDPKENSKNIKRSDHQSKDSSVPADVTSVNQTKVVSGNTTHEVQNAVKIKQTRESHSTNNEDLGKNSKNVFSVGISKEEVQNVGIKSHFVSFKTEDDEGFIVKQEQSLNGGVGDLIDINNVIEKENKALIGESRSGNTINNTKSFRKQGSAHKVTENHDQLEKTSLKSWKRDREELDQNHQTLKLEDITNVENSSTPRFLANDTKDVSTKHNHTIHFANSPSNYLNSNKSVSKSSVNNTKENITKKIGAFPVDREISKILQRSNTKENILKNTGDLTTVRQNVSKTSYKNNTKSLDDLSGVNKNVSKTSYQDNTNENVSKNLYDVQSVDRKLSQMSKINGTKENTANGFNDFPYGNKKVTDSSHPPNNAILNATKKPMEGKESSDRTGHKSKQERIVDFYVKKTNLQQPNASVPSNNIISSYVKENILNSHESGKTKKYEPQNTKLNPNKTQKNEIESNVNFLKELKMEAGKDLKKNNSFKNRQTIMKEDKELVSNINANEKNITNKTKMLSNSAEGKVDQSNTENKNVQTSETNTNFKPLNVPSGKQDVMSNARVKTDVKSNNKQITERTNSATNVNHKNEMNKLKYKTEGTDKSTQNNISVKKSENLTNSNIDSKPLNRNISTKQFKGSQNLENTSNIKNKSEGKRKNKSTHSSNLRKNIDVSDTKQVVEDNRIKSIRSNTQDLKNIVKTNIDKTGSLTQSNKNNKELNNTSDINSIKHNNELKLTKNIANDRFKQRAELRKEFKAKMNQLLKSLTITGLKNKPEIRFTKPKSKEMSNKSENVTKRTEIIKVTRSSQNVFKENTVNSVTQSSKTSEPTKQIVQQENIVKGNQVKTGTKSLDMKFPFVNNKTEDVVAVRDKKLKDQNIKTSITKKHSSKISDDQKYKNNIENSNIKLAESKAAARLRKVAKIIPFSKDQSPKRSSPNPIETIITEKVISQKRNNSKLNENSVITANKSNKAKNKL